MKIIILILLCISILAGIFLYGGFGSSSNAEQLSLIYRMDNNSYLSNDWFININEGVNVRFYSSSFFLFLNKFIPNFEILYFFLFLTTYFLIGSATYAISKHLFKNKKIALLTAFFVIFGADFTLGGVAIASKVIESVLISVVFVLWGFYFFLKKNYLLFSLMFGIALLFHFLLGGLIFAILFLAEVFTDKFQIKKHFKKYLKMISIILLAFFIISPIFLSQLNTSISLSGKEVVKILGEIRNPHHHMPFSWNWIVYAKFFFFFFLFWQAFKDSKVEPRIKSLVKKIAYTISVLFFIGMFFVEIIPITLIIKLGLFRTSIFISFIGYLFIIPYLYKKTKESFKEKLILRSLYCLFLMIALFSSPLILMALPIFLMGEYIYKNKKSFFTKLNKPEYIFVEILSLSIIFLVFFSPIITTMSNQGIEALIIKLSIYFLFLSFMLIFLSKKNYLKVLGIIFIIFLSLSIIFVRLPIINYAYEEDTKEMYDFIKEFTPQDTILLTPPYLEPFRLGTERAIVVDFKLCPYSEIGMFEWYERIKDVSNNINLEMDQPMVTILSQGYNSLTKEEVLILKEEYNFSYAIFEGPNDLNFTTVFQNDKFVVYKV